MLTFLVWGIAVLAILSNCYADGCNLVFTKNGKAESCLIIKPDASAPVKFAAEELQKYIQKMSGAKIAVFTEQPKDSNKMLQIYLGGQGNTDKSIPESVVNKVKNASKDETFYIKNEGNKLFIIGKTPVATLYGAYTLLEMFGVRWFYPGEQGEYFPQKTTLSLPSIDSFQSPSMNQSGLNLVCASFNLGKTYEWMVRNKINVERQPGFRVYADQSSSRGNKFFDQRAIYPRQGGGHNWARRAVPGEEYFKSHPEYFVMLKDGKRHWDAKGRYQRCFSNPEVQKLCSDYILKMTKQGRVFCIAAEDTVGNYCHCPECKAMGTVDGKFGTTNLYHRFFSKLIDNVLTQNPKAKFKIPAYTEFREAPAAKDISYNPSNVTVEICTHQRCYVHTFDDQKCKSNKEQYKLYMDWRKICPNIKFYDYINCAHSMYAPWEYVMAKDFKKFAKDGCAGWTDECPPPFAGYVERLKKMYPKAPEKWFSRWQLYYVLAKLSWNANLKLGDILNDAYDKYYGKAAEVMKKYHALRHKLWESAPGHAFYGGPVRIAYCLTVPGAAEQLDSMLKKAMDCNNDPIVNKRIEMDKYYLDNYWKKEAAKMKKLFSTERKIVPVQASVPIVIDGVLSEKDWIKARPIDNFLNLSSKAPAQEKTSVRVLYDKNNIYFGVVAMAKKQWGKEKTNITKHDGNVWCDDSVELQIAPSGSQGGFYHIITNTKGVIYDSYMAGSNIDKKYSSQAEVKVKKLADRYIYEIKLPLKAMNAKIIPGQDWQMHFIRNCNALQPPVTNETSGVDGTGPHKLLNFRRAFFGKNIIHNGNFTLLAKYPKDIEGLDNRRFPKYWGIRSDYCKINKIGSGNSLTFSNGTIFVHMQTFSLTNDGKLKITVNASGNGELYVFFRTWQSKKSYSNNKRFNHRNVKTPAVKLSKAVKTYTFNYNFLKDEQGYFYLYVKGRVTVNNINGIVTLK